MLYQKLTLEDSKFNMILQLTMDFTFLISICVPLIHLIIQHMQIFKKNADCQQPEFEEILTQSLSLSHKSEKIGGLAFISHSHASREITGNVFNDRSIFQSNRSSYTLHQSQKIALNIKSKHASSNVAALSDMNNNSGSRKVSMKKADSD